MLRHALRLRPGVSPRGLQSLVTCSVAHEGQGRSGVGVARRAAFGVFSRRFMNTLPPHEVQGMPALSPTMESGNVGEWIVSVSYLREEIMK